MSSTPPYDWGTEKSWFQMDELERSGMTDERFKELYEAKFVNTSAPEDSYTASLEQRIVLLEKEVVKLSESKDKDNETICQMIRNIAQDQGWKI